MTFRLIFKELNELKELPEGKYTMELPGETIVAKKNDEIVIEETEINENDEIKLIQIIYGG